MWKYSINDLISTDNLQWLHYGSVVTVALQFPPTDQNRVGCLQTQASLAKEICHLNEICLVKKRLQNISL